MAEPVRPAERHAAREAALQMLYQWEVGGESLDEVLRTYTIVAPQALDGPGRAFAEALVQGAARQLTEIDQLIAEQAQHWRLERMAVVDRLILRLATYELLRQDTPVAVVIDEAIELARTFSTEPAVRFVNGMLDAIGQRIRKPEPDNSRPS